MALTAALALGTLSITSFSVAQNNMSESDNQSQMQRQNPMQKMLEELNLTQAQQTQIEAIMQNNRPDQSSGRPSNDERQAQQAAIQAQIEAVLTSEQQAVFAESLKNLPTGGQGGQRPQR